MFEHTYEQEIASVLITNYNRKRLACGNDKKYYHAIGILFQFLLKQLNINISVIYKDNSIQLITKSNLLDSDKSNKIHDLSPKITENLNLHELRVVKFLQTISFLKNLEEQNYIIILNCKDKQEHPEPEIYDSYEITDPNLVVFINRLRGSRIIPTTALIEISAYEFKTVEKRQYEKQVKLSEDAISEARKANVIAADSNNLAKIANELAENANCAAILVALFTFLISFGIAVFIPSSLTQKTIHEIGREIHLNVEKETIPNININHYHEKIDTTKYGKIQNEKP